MRQMRQSKKYRSMLPLIILALIFSACGRAPLAGPGLTAPGGETDTPSPTAAAPAGDGNSMESPMLWPAVAAGELPPLEERLPDNPLVLQPLEEIGSYGGTLRRGSAVLNPYLTENFTREPLTMWQLPLTSAGPPVPNLAESWEYNEDATEVTVHLRQGIKWSDGEPFTSADIEFYWNDILLDENVNESMPPILNVDGQAPGLEVIDDYTIKFIYPRPYRFFAEANATVWEIAWPKHYMQQFHPKYNSSATYDDLNANAELETGRGRVTLQAWMLDEWMEGDMYKLKRNPYYWKVDPEGKQLPYFDYATVDIVEDRQSVALGNVTGDFDLDAMWVGVQHLPLFMEAIQDGRDISLTTADFAGVAQFFNLDHTDPVKRAMFRDLAFRRAYSMAINRQEIGDLYYSGLLQPMGMVFSPSSPYYQGEDGQLWSGYDPAGANTLLDEAGYNDVDGDGFREAPDGSPIELIIDVGQHDLYTPIVELIVSQYLPAIGLKAIMNVKDQTTIRDQYIAGSYDIHTWDLDGADYPEADALGGISPRGPNTPLWHPNWQADPVSDDFLRMAELMESATALDFDERVTALTEASHLHADNVWIILTGYFERPFVKSERLGNTPDKITRNSQVNDQPPWQAMLLFEKYPPGQRP